MRMTDVTPRLAQWTLDAKLHMIPQRPLPLPLSRQDSLPREKGCNSNGALAVAMAVGVSDNSVVVYSCAAYPTSPHALQVSLH